MLESSHSKSESSKSSIGRKNDADHFVWSVGMALGSDERYKVSDHLGDGTFGRALRCLDVKTQEILAVKVVRAVQRYAHSAKIED